MYLFFSTDEVAHSRWWFGPQLSLLYTRYTSSCMCVGLHSFTRTTDLRIGIGILSLIAL